MRTRLPTPTIKTDPACKYGTEPTCVTDCVGPVDQAVVHFGRTTGTVLARHPACRAHVYELLVRTRWSGTRDHSKIEPYTPPTTQEEPDGPEHGPVSGPDGMDSCREPAKQGH